MAAVATPLSHASEWIDHECRRQVFFRFVDGTNMVLTLHRETRIYDVKTLLVQKALSCSASEAKRADPTQDSFASLFLGFVWLASLFSASPATVTPKDIFLTSNGKLLDDDCTVAQYHNLSHVQVSARIRGGCFMLSATVFATICTACVCSMCTCGLSLVVVPFLLPLLFILPLFCL